MGQQKCLGSVKPLSQQPHTLTLHPDSYLEGQGALVSGLIRVINRVTIWVIWVINLLKSP